MVNAAQLNFIQYKEVLDDFEVEFEETQALDDADDDGRQLDSLGLNEQ